MSFPLPQGPAGLILAAIVIAALLSLFFARRTTRPKGRAHRSTSIPPSIVDRMREEGLL